MSRSKQSSTKERGPEKPPTRPGTKATRPGEGDAVRSFGRILLIAVLALAVLAVAAGVMLVLPTLVQRDQQRELATAATFVGSEACAGCHRAKAELWRSSQHKHATDHATDKSVLGDFTGASFDHYGVHSRFFRQDGKYLVET